jgi:hypothetical protein
MQDKVQQEAMDSDQQLTINFLEMGLVLAGNTRYLT